MNKHGPGALANKAGAAWSSLTPLVLVQKLRLPGSAVRHMERGATRNLGRFGCSW